MPELFKFIEDQTKLLQAAYIKMPEVTLQKRMTRMAGACPGFGSAEHVEDDKGPTALAKPETDPLVSFCDMHCIHFMHIFLTSMFLVSYCLQSPQEIAEEILEA